MAKADAPREQLFGPRSIGQALDAGRPVRLLLARQGPLSEAASRTLERARAAGIPVRIAGDRELLRLAISREPQELLALVGGDPGASIDDTLDGGGAVWLLVGVTYVGNAGYAIRCAEVSGASGIAIDASFSRSAQREACRASMRADRFFPVHFCPAEDLVVRARERGFRVVAIEDVGSCAPWEVDLTGPTLLVVGGEEEGIPESLLRSSDHVVRVPMRGFIPSYNLQAAMAALAGERLRQLHLRE